MWPTSSITSAVKSARIVPQIKRTQGRHRDDEMFTFQLLFEEGLGMVVVRILKKRLMNELLKLLL